MIYTSVVGYVATAPSPTPYPFATLVMLALDSGFIYAVWSGTVAKYAKDLGILEPTLSGITVPLAAFILFNVARLFGLEIFPALLISSGILIASFLLLWMPLLYDKFSPDKLQAVRTHLMVTLSFFVGLMILIYFLSEKFPVLRGTQLI